MHWQEISVKTTEIMEEAVTNLLYEVGAAGVVIEDPNLINRYVREDAWDAYEFSNEILNAEHIVVKGYLPVDQQLPKRLEQFSGSLAALSGFFEDFFAEVNLTRLHEEDWANSWKAYYKPLKIGQRLVIVPGWENYQAEEGDIIIELDPGMAFGTGNHPTTTMCVKMLDKYCNPGDYVADVGTGSGIVAIAAAKIGAVAVDAIDLDTLAVRIAILNVKRNHVEGVVNVSQGHLLCDAKGPYEIIVANIIADAIIELTDDAWKTLAPEGVFISSGIIEDRLEDVEKKLKQLGFKVVEILTDKDWRCVVARKGSGAGASV